MATDTPKERLMKEMFDLIEYNTQRLIDISPIKDGIVSKESLEKMIDKYPYDNLKRFRK